MVQVFEKTNNKGENRDFTKVTVILVFIASLWFLLFTDARHQFFFGVVGIIGILFVRYFSTARIVTISTKENHPAMTFIFVVVCGFIIVAMLNTVIGVPGDLAFNILAAFTEEVFFRGFVLQLILALLSWSDKKNKLSTNYKLGLSICISSLFFMMHPQYLGNVVAMLSMFILGTFCGIAFAITREVIPSILIHSLWNLLVYYNANYFNLIIDVLVCYILYLLWNTKKSR